METTKEKTVSIQSIKILMGKKEVELSIEEAKKLKSALEEIFGVKIIEKTEHIHHHDYFRYWKPYYVNPIHYDFGDVFYCNSTAGGDSTNISNQQQLCLSIK